MCPGMDDVEDPEFATATVKFMLWLELYEKEKPFQILIDVPEDSADQTHNNQQFERKEQIFRNTRGQENSFDFDAHGFTYRFHDSDFDDFEDQQRVESVYLPKVESLLRKGVEGIDRVLFFDWRVWWLRLCLSTCWLKFCSLSWQYSSFDIAAGSLQEKRLIWTILQTGFCLLCMFILASRFGVTITSRLIPFMSLRELYWTEYWCSSWRSILFTAR